jgi:protein tyrosine/serine phosphatase
VKLRWAIPRTKGTIIMACCLVVALSLTAVVAGQEVRWSASHRGEKLAVAGVNNFGRMNDRLYRGAQPTSAGFAQLRAMGIETVVRLSLGEEGGSAERAVVESLGMRFVNLPWSSVHDPKADQVVAFLTLMKDDPDRKVFVHCKAGADRTGVFVALYRIAFDHWTAERAIDEMKAFHYRWVFLPHLQAYVERFPSRLNSEPAFVSLESANVY